MLASTKNVLADPSLCHSIMTGMKDFWEQVAKQNPSTGVTRWRETGPSEQIVLYSKINTPIKTSKFFIENPSSKKRTTLSMHGWFIKISKLAEMVDLNLVKSTRVIICC